MNSNIIKHQVICNMQSEDMTRENIIVSSPNCKNGNTHGMQQYPKYPNTRLGVQFLLLFFNQEGIKIADQMSRWLITHINVGTENDVAERQRNQSLVVCGGLGACSLELWTTLHTLLRSCLSSSSPSITHSLQALLLLVLKCILLLSEKAKKLSASTSQKTKTMKMMSQATMEESKKKMSCRRLGGYLRQQKGRLYIIRRCVVMLLCWHDQAKA